MDMHEQDFVPGPQSHEQGLLNEDKIHYPAQPYYWSTQKPDAPKDEPASRYDDPMVQGDNFVEYEQGYSVTHSMGTSGAGGTGYSDGESQSSFGEKAQTGRTGQTRSRFQQQQYSPDGDAFEQQYQHRFNNAPNRQWSVPSWARPQAQRSWGRSSRWFWFVLLALVFMGPLLHVIGFLLVAGVIFLALLFPLLIIGILSILFLLSRALTGRAFPQRRWRYTRPWRMNSGPWRW